jgi:hypothetical protein
MDFLNSKKELKTLHLIFSKNEERVNQLEKIEQSLKNRLGGNIDG